MKIILSGNPLSTNNIYKIACKPFARSYLSAKGKQRKSDYTIEALSQKKNKTLTDELELCVTLYFGDKRVRDWDNFHKLSMDSLTDAGIWEDDRQVIKCLVIKDYDKENPRIEIEINPLKSQN